MSEDTYHHGDLRRALVETGLRLVHEKGEGQCSLRRVAALCGVSSAAPYAHFKNKEELLTAMRDHVTREFLTVLEQAKGSGTPDAHTLLRMGRAYVLFFKENPQYYSFVFSRKELTVVLDGSAAGSESYPPYALFRQTAREVLEQPGAEPEHVNDSIIARWAMVHGLAAIAAMKNVMYSESWEEKTVPILTSLSRPL